MRSTRRDSRTIRLTTDKTSLLADGKSLAYVTVHVLDDHGVQVPDADNTMHVSVSGAGAFAGADNGKEDDAEGYKSTTHGGRGSVAERSARARRRPLDFWSNRYSKVQTQI